VLTRCSSGYCDKCRPADTTNWGAWQQKHGTSSQRGYDAEWMKLRQVVLERDSFLCQHCYAQGVFTRATHVDHIKPKSQGGTNDLSNLQGLCKACHATKTATERRRGAG